MRAKVTKIALSGGFQAVARKMTRRERGRSLKQTKILEGVGIEPALTALQVAALYYKSIGCMRLPPDLPPRIGLLRGMVITLLTRFQHSAIVVTM
jgi:hypothetical protein